MSKNINDKKDYELVKEKNNDYIFNVYEKFSKIIVLISAIVINILLISFILNAKDKITKIILFVFLNCTLCFLSYTIVDLFSKENLKRIFIKSYIIIFMLYWFGFIIFWTYKVIEAGSYSMIWFTIPFWLSGMLIIYKEVIKK